ncbi:MAG: tRNA (guanosine(46)-N7)-methyltransferase TrmB, partial [Firmicutes bacterium]|nr:tRNA (guanosine(46)-N7)-methyltransferase TrmB [Bacillota bacterium]
GKWREVFGNEGRLYLELGCGKGKFITARAMADPEASFIGIEGLDAVIVRGLEKAVENEVTNVRYVLEYVKDIREFFEDGELDGIYLNFSDPWPKARHAKRRLTFHKKLKQYVQILREGGHIEFKTDNDGLFEFTLEQIAEAEMTILEMSRDLHNSPYAEKNIPTEYEDKFSQKGKNINYVSMKA